MTRDTEQEVKPCKFVGVACVNCDATERGDCQGFVYNTHAPREWVGLTDEDVNREFAMIAKKMKLAFHAGMYVAQQILKEKNT